jgi:molybdopterin converting factor small subunit
MAQIKYDEWFARYRPHTNKSGDIIYYETFGRDLDKVERHSPYKQVWTLIDAEGELLITSGTLFANRVNYIICDVPYELSDEDDFIEVVD